MHGNRYNILRSFSTVEYFTQHGIHLMCGYQETTSSSLWWWPHVHNMLQHICRPLFSMVFLTNQREVSLSLSWNHTLPNMYTPGALHGHHSTYREMKCTIFKAQYWNLCTITELHCTQALMSPGHCNIVLKCVSGIQTDQPAATCLIRLKPEVVIHINVTISWTKNKKTW